MKSEGNGFMPFGSKVIDHEHFGELSALAASGQLPSIDYEEWKAHLQSCADCRAEYASFADLSVDALPYLHEENPLGGPMWRLVRNVLHPNDHAEQRFLEKARVEGLPVGTQGIHAVGVWDSVKFFVRPRFVYLYAILLVLLIVIGSLAQRLNLKESENQRYAAEIAKLNEKAAVLQQQVSGISQQGEDKLAQSHAQLQDLASRGDVLAGQLKDATAQIQTLRSETTVYRSAESDLDGRLQQAQATIGQLTNELHEIRGLRATDAVTIREQQARLDEVQRQYSTQLQAIYQEKNLLSADRDVRDLMGARNLHIVDVFDVDGKGRMQCPFGRVFYTEGKSLIFYAFDLNGQKHGLVNASFQAWGAQEINEQQAQSLGVFYQDDKAQNRWALKFNDPATLAAIDYVFVTVEPAGGSKTPSAHKVLYAYLNTKPNHP